MSKRVVMMGRWLSLAAVVGIVLLTQPSSTRGAGDDAAATTPASEHGGTEAKESEHGDHEDHGHGDHAHTIHGQPPKGLLGPGTEFLYIDPILFVWTIGVFLLTWFLLSTLAWKPMIHSLEVREHTIASSLAKAEQIRAEARQLLADQDAELAKAQEEAKRILDEAREKASRESETLITQAREEAVRSQTEAEARIAEARTEALGQIKSLAGTLSADIATKVTQKRFSAGDYRHLVEEVAP